MTERNIGRNEIPAVGTTSSAFESPWTQPGSFSQLSNFQAGRTYDSLPPLTLSGADSTGRPVSGDPNIINLVGGGTKDLRLADQPAGMEESGRGTRQRLSPQEYSEKLRHLDSEASMDVIKQKKSVLHKPKI